MAVDALIGVYEVSQPSLAEEPVDAPDCPVLVVPHTLRNFNSVEDIPYTITNRTLQALCFKCNFFHMVYILKSKATDRDGASDSKWICFNKEFFSLWV